ncbi:Hypothetical predicted protein [Mytilus galloprovincialis]|uniref:Ig-like domain-containing protein n=1 Tax=Mytilus galloprovincialis TaxID=29158 RepID=A0A8B6DMP6_MYTGA|nr:Hypothetical predicted protein [Mytilus galloprovincialis]
MFPGKSDQGEYTCIAVNDLGQRGSLPTLLSVSGGLPEVSIGIPAHSATFGESFTIHCKVIAVPPHTHIYWEHITERFIRIIRKDTLGVSGVTLHDPTLTIDYVTTSDAGSYTCSAENALGKSSSKSTILNVDGDMPVVEVPLTSYTVKHGHDVALLCIVSSKPKHTNVYWIKDSDKGKLVYNHGTTGTIGMTVENPSLSLKPVIITDSGLYTCLASNVIGTGASRAISLIGKDFCI